jgi:hypothetical protein
VKTLLSYLLVLTACGDDGGTFQDAALADPCAPEMTFTGELVEWTSTDTAFMGVPNATFSQGGVSAKSAPNGRFSMCIPAMNGVVDIEPAAAQTRLNGTVVVNRLVLGLQPLQSYRGLPMTEATSLGLSPAMGHVFVHVDGAARTVSTSGAAAIQKHFDGAAWVDGNAGENVFLGNIDAQLTTTLTISGGDSLGGGEIPLTAGEITYVTVVAR